MKNDLDYNELITSALFGALWGVIEVFLGTILHASKIPFRGTVLTIIAVVLITTSRSFINYKGSMIAISAVAATLKLITLPGFNITPFIAIIMQGIIAEIVFSFFNYNFISSLFAGSSIMLYTLIHSLIMQGIFFGLGIYNVYIELLNSIGRAMNYDGQMSLVLIPIIILLYILFGAGAGWYGYATANRTKQILKESTT
jgi:ABC-type thiamin/hydroxymethylpyrimidine transport system permease subunit